MTKPEKLMIDGKRLDGRGPNELRPIKFKAGVLKRADGSCYLEFGGNKVMAAVYGPREVHPRHLQNASRAIVRYRYNMAAFSVEERKRPGPDRRSIEISKVSREALESVVLEELYPRSAVDIFVEILQADAGTRVAGINAASVALADAGIPMRCLVSACSVGKIDGEVVLDLNKDEDNYGQADLPVAVNQFGEVTLCQMDGHLTEEEFGKALDMAVDGCKKLHEMQKQALVEKYGTMVAQPAEEEAKANGGVANE
ncbi:putative exosome complex exonuclease 1 [Methanocella paludicola SANAE]|uniref:Exosome complex component Rrp41 n=1 Tax=Methanocella paludicola (strain DSM 17711 / JCM 13418 / NBRC 101707 / SANAE) TaxID=304371 RepID=D1Z1X7_METPS|nr:exosome complex exonuclease Rrp41 [Methanocella paludicola]BAI62699.1 putative exosome complex exonuclease 1 [Methanocella paludicola SANAE]